MSKSHLVDPAVAKHLEFLVARLNWRMMEECFKVGFQFADIPVETIDVDEALRESMRRAVTAERRALTLERRQLRKVLRKCDSID